MSSSPPIIIAGAGIGGLTAALALAHCGRRVRILEQAARLEETGAGLQLSPNATRVLLELGLRERLRSQVVAPEVIYVRKSASGRELAQLPLRHIAQTYGAPYWVIHRGDLHSALLAAVGEQANIALELGARVHAFTFQANTVSVNYQRNEGAAETTGAAFIGADGLWSASRACLGLGLPPRPAGRTAWRALVPAAAVPAPFRLPAVHLWVGPKAHLVHYPVRAGAAINIVVITTDAWTGIGWSTRGERKELLAGFRTTDWAEAARTMLAIPEVWLKWALYDCPPLQSWGHGAATLLGDAAHPMLPFLAQGAAMAIEDAAVLAHALAQAEDGVAAALRSYARQRRPRTARVQKAARANDRIYHLGGPAAIIRDVAMTTMLRDARLLSRYDWIYAWRPPERAAA